jgi:hypothetical protein
MTLLNAVARKRRRRSLITTSRWQALPLSPQQLVGDVAHAAISDCASPPAVMRVGRGAKECCEIKKLAK